MTDTTTQIALAAGDLVALPLAHVGHYLWVFYLIPVLIVVGGIIHTTRADKRRNKKR